jgi:hypothetical protein
MKPSRWWGLDPPRIHGLEATKARQNGDDADVRRQTLVDCALGGEERRGGDKRHILYLNLIN